MKRIFFSILVFLTLFTNLIYANIDEQIDAIKHASVKERFKLMNEFKKNLIQMKEKERIEAIKKLSIKSNNKNAKKALDELKQHTKRNKLQKQIEDHHIDEDNMISVTDDQGGENDD